MFSNHCDFPPRFAFEISELINVVNLVMDALCCSTQLTNLCFQAVFKGINCITVNNDSIANVNDGISISIADDGAAHMYYKWSEGLTSKISSYKLNGENASTQEANRRYVSGDNAELSQQIYIEVNGKFRLAKKQLQRVGTNQAPAPFVG